MDTQTHPDVEASTTQPSMSAGRTTAATRMRTRHGLHSKYAVVPGESEDAFRAFRHAMVESLQPVTPVEAAVAEQMVMAQWKLQRLWATETGVYVEYDAGHPANDGTHPQRLSATLHWDYTKQDRQLDRLSLHQQRLVNIFHKGIAKLALIQDQRSKFAARSKDRFDAREPVSYAPAEHVPGPAETLASPSSSVTSGESADREPRVAPAGPSSPASREGESSAPQTQAAAMDSELAERDSSHCLQGEVAHAAERLREAPATLAGEGLRGAATPSPDSGSTEIADRGESAPPPPASAAEAQSGMPPAAATPEPIVYRDAPLDHPELSPDDVPGHFAPPLSKREIQRLEAADNQWRAVLNKARAR